ncbi:MAG: sulfatase-like hydrolase/transferase [Bacteroidales bacterium]
MIDNNFFIGGATIGAVLLFLPCVVEAGEKPEDGRPDIILIMTDQQTLGAMSFLGNPYLSTSAMDALASDALSLTRAYCPFPLSGPSRAALMTGLMPVQTGATDNDIRPSDASMRFGLGLRLKKAGYECLYAGKWHVTELNVPDNAGFRKVCDTNDPILAQECSGALDSRDKSKPLFLVASFLDPHEICEFARDEALHYGPIGPFDTKDCPNLPSNFMPSTYEAEAIRMEALAAPRSHPSANYSEDQWRRYLFAYYRLVERADSYVGELLTVLKEKDLYDNSVVIFISDHGDGAAAHQWNQKWALFEECINVPLMIKAPGAVSGKGAVNRTALSNTSLDVYSTICDYAGVSLDKNIYKGLSLRPLVERKTGTLHDEVFVETYLSGIKTRGWSVIDGKYKYVIYNWFANNEMLYDLESDKGEMINLAVDKRYSDVLFSMRNKLYEWSLEVRDPRLPRILKALTGARGTESGHIDGNR